MPIHAARRYGNLISAVEFVFAWQCILKDDRENSIQGSTAIMHNTTANYHLSNWKLVHL